jgi:hypothetical protein
LYPCRSGRSSSDDEMVSSYCVGSFFLFGLGRLEQAGLAQVWGEVWVYSSMLLNSDVWYMSVRMEPDGINNRVTRGELVVLV